MLAGIGDFSFRYFKTLRLCLHCVLVVCRIVSDELCQTDRIVAVREADRCTGNISTRVR